jgi:hypothetical protein
VTYQGVHRRTLRQAVQAAWWLDADQDAAAIRAAGDLADIIDQLRLSRDNQTMMGARHIDSKEAWHAAVVHGRYLAALEALRLTPSTRPEVVTDQAADLIDSLKRSLRDTGD